MGENLPHNARMAATIAAERGALWLRDASARDLSEATDAYCRGVGGAYDTRGAILCLKAIREYQRQMRTPYAPDVLERDAAHLAATVATPPALKSDAFLDAIVARVGKSPLDP